MVIGGALEGLWIGRADALAQPRYEGRFILDPKDSKATVLTNLSVLVALGALAPLPFGVRLGGHARLLGEVGDDLGGNVLRALREPPVKLEGFEQDGEAEPSGACLVAEQRTLIVR